MNMQHRIFSIFSNSKTEERNLFQDVSRIYQQVTSNKFGKEVSNMVDLICLAFFNLPHEQKPEFLKAIESRLNYRTKTELPQAITQAILEKCG